MLRRIAYRDREHGVLLVPKDLGRLRDRPDLGADALHLAGAAHRSPPAARAAPRRSGARAPRAADVRRDRGRRDRPGRGRPGVPRRDARHRHRAGPLVADLVGGHPRHDRRRLGVLVAGPPPALPAHRGHHPAADRRAGRARDAGPLRRARRAAVDGRALDRAGDSPAGWRARSSYRCCSG
ncbi:hypothetical protein [Nocardioides convexus]|uniref:hypothetical protein n=1 Tax=Nocardioides convexus TaxID=2712224 RepID=UPI0024182C4C|nr:hypothetical protein [Nocardioides convexus]